MDGSLIAVRMSKTKWKWEESQRNCFQLEFGIFSVPKPNWNAKELSSSCKKVKYYHKVNIFILRQDTCPASIRQGFFLISDLFSFNEIIFSSKVMNLSKLSTIELLLFFKNPLCCVYISIYFFTESLSIRLDVIVGSLALRKSLVIDEQSIGRAKIKKEIQQVGPYGNQQTSGSVG